MKAIWRASVFGLVSCLATTCALAAPTLAVETTRGYPGVTTPLTVSVLDVSNIAALQWDVAFDTSTVTLESVGLDSALSNHVLRTREIAPGLQRVLVYSLGNATLLESNRVSVSSLPFTVNPAERVGSGPITPFNALLVQPDASVVSVALTEGELFVTPVHRDPVSGVVDFFLSSDAGTNYVIDATQDFILWEPISTNLAVGDFLDLVDPAASNYTHRFYRARPLP